MSLCLFVFVMRDKILILLRERFVVVELLLLYVDVCLSWCFQRWRSVKNWTALCSKGHLDIRYKLQQDRDAEVFRARARNLANGQLHRISVRRSSDTLSIQVMSCSVCSFSLHLTSRWILDKRGRKRKCYCSEVAFLQLLRTFCEFLFMFHLSKLFNQIVKTSTHLFEEWDKKTMCHLTLNTETYFLTQTLPVFFSLIGRSAAVCNDAFQIAFKSIFN